MIELIDNYNILIFLLKNNVAVWSGVSLGKHSIKREEGIEWKEGISNRL